MKNKILSLNQNTVFKRLYYRGKSVCHSFLVVYFMKNKTEPDYVRLGITVSKKLGKAVKRNRIRRIIREAFRVYEKRVKPGYNLVIVARFASVDKKYSEFVEALNILLVRAKLLD